LFHVIKPVIVGFTIDAMRKGKDKDIISIILADDHKVVRHAIKVSLETEAEFRVIGEAGDGLEAVKQTKNLQPDILVVDISMPGPNGIEVTRQVRKCSPKTKVVILSMHSAEVYVRQALEAGAMGYVLKESVPEHLINAIREALAGRNYVSPPFSKRLLKNTG
jgi:DNA-binding NarL/FixJ family response regulator